MLVHTHTSHLLTQLAWTALYRKAHKKDAATEASRKKRKTNKVTAARAIGSATLEVLQKKRTERPDVRAAARDAALREIKERARKLKEEKAKARMRTVV